MKLTLLSPEKKILENIEADVVTLPTSEGQIQILPGHAKIMGLLDTGVFEYSKNGSGRHGVITSGFFEVANDEIKVVSETFEYSDEIDSSRAKKAQAKAEASLSDPSLDPQMFKKYELKLQRALIRQQASTLR